ncbi:hypothetical protein SCHPADRAFT_947165 [Schizopora paradoxa]|uniref:Uncharacterized protein n=1 Tax=Schizopora paradoxa TaxID=27342 RepID=A0A0H2RK04_9AGAM|nr:hypothetical protein SCHPADRAFT_947165 [Schizopora paradoxa]
MMHGNSALPVFDPFLEYMFFRFGFVFPSGGLDYQNCDSWLPSVFIFKAEHFCDWENRVGAFMQTLRSRLVWKVGGVLWRLALHFAETLDSAFASLDAVPGNTVRSVTPENLEEVLTEEEVNPLIGLCLIAPLDPTLMANKNVSLCPHPRYRGAMFDNGGWTPSNEN